MVSGYFISSFVLLTGMLPAAPRTAIFWVSGPVDSKGVVMVTGQFRPSLPISVQVAELSKKRLDWHKEVDQEGTPVAVIKQTEHAIMFQLPGGSESLYGFRLNQYNELPLYGGINQSEIWWALFQLPSKNGVFDGEISKDHAAPGSTIRLFGRCLMHAGRPDVIQVTSHSGSTKKLTTIADGDYALTATLPPDIATGQFTLSLDTTATTEPPTLIQFNIEVESERPNHKINLVAVEGVGDGVADNYDVLSRALLLAAVSTPGIVSIPSGLYFCSKPLQVPPGVYLEGISRETSAIYFPDLDTPPQSWISGLRDFGLANLSIYCGNHKSIITSDMSGDVLRSGHIRIQNVLIRGNSFSGHMSEQVLTERSAKLLQSHGNMSTTIQLSGPDIQISSSDILGSGMSFRLYKADGAILVRNKIYNGRFGWYSIEGSQEVDFSENRIEGADLSSSGGEYSVPKDAKTSKNIYTAHNTYNRMPGWDNEAFTSDGGGGAYFGTISRVDDNSLELPNNPTRQDEDWGGTLVAITSGRGLGQWRTVRSIAGRRVKLSAAFEISPDETSVITIVPLQLHYAFYRNKFTDAGIALQFFGSGVEHIAAENQSDRAGGFRVFSLQYFDGVEPQINAQFIANTLSGYGYKNTQPGLRPGMGYSTLEAQSNKPSVIIGLVFRNNILGENCILHIASWGRAGMKSVLLDGNLIRNKEINLKIEKSVESEVVVR